MLCVECSMLCVRLVSDMKVQILYSSSARAKTSLINAKVFLEYS